MLAITRAHTRFGSSSGPVNAWHAEHAAVTAPSAGACALGVGAAAGEGGASGAGAGCAAGGAGRGPSQLASASVAPISSKHISFNTKQSSSSNNSRSISYTNK
jgi:hypothetical protein